MPLIPREKARLFGREALAILRARSYLSPLGIRVEIGESLDRAVTGTIEYPPDCDAVADFMLGLTPVISVENETVLNVGRRLAAAGPIAALNFASATSPGGGFLDGSRAQEEGIAWSSGLYACLEHSPMYAFHQQALDARYSHWAIYSPEVPVFRAGGELLETPWSMSIITCPAVNVEALRRYAPERLVEIPRLMRERAHKVLAIAVKQGHRRLILGAWGCGAFGIESRVMADIFHTLLTSTFARAFEQIAFAITDWSEERKFIAPFRATFA